MMSQWQEIIEIAKLSLMKRISLSSSLNQKGFTPLALYMVLLILEVLEIKICPLFGA
jgi:hypothetical protein